jgi:hypothetical protein
LIIQPGLGALRAVAANLAPQTLEEAIEANIQSETLPDLLMDALCSARLFLVHSFFFDDGTPAAVMAVAQHGSAPYNVDLKPPTTFLIGARGFFEESIKHRRLLKEHMASLYDKFGPIYTRTHSVHSNMARWLRMMGYVRVPDGENLYRWG